MVVNVEKPTYVRVYLDGPTYVYGSYQKDPQFHDVCVSSIHTYNIAKMLV